MSARRENNNSNEKYSSYKGKTTSCTQINEHKFSRDKFYRKNLHFESYNSSERLNLCKRVPLNSDVGSTS